MDIAKIEDWATSDSSEINKLRIFSRILDSQLLTMSHLYEVRCMGDADEREDRWTRMDICCPEWTEKQQASWTLR